MALSAAKVEQVILGLLERRAPGKTICPSDAARALDAEDWRALLAPVREQARAMAADGRLEVTQGGRVVDPDSARGAIRLRCPAPSRPRRR